MAELFEKYSRMLEDASGTITPEQLANRVKHFTALASGTSRSYFHMKAEKLLGKELSIELMYIMDPDDLHYNQGSKINLNTLRVTMLKAMKERHPEEYQRLANALPELDSYADRAHDMARAHNDIAAGKYNKSKPQ